ncbi:hypothetical protein JHK86_004372 [Glycine max]|nr:hypothetical protein JHK86_004372 [Glycine max]
MGSQDYDFGASLCVNLTSQGAKSNKVPLRKEGRSEYGGSLRRLSSKLLDDHNWIIQQTKSQRSILRMSALGGDGYLMISQKVKSHIAWDSFGSRVYIPFSDMGFQDIIASAWLRDCCCILGDLPLEDIVHDLQHRFQQSKGLSWLKT